MQASNTKNQKTVELEKKFQDLPEKNEGTFMEVIKSTLNGQTNESKKSILSGVMVHGVTLLSFAIVNGYNTLVQFLFNIHVDVNTQDTRGRTALHNIARADYEKVKDALPELIKAGINVNAQDNKGCTALHLASFAGKVEMVKYLLENSSDQSIKDNQGRDALDSVADGIKLYGEKQGRQDVKKILEVMVRPGPGVSATSVQEATRNHDVEGLTRS